MVIAVVSVISGTVIVALVFAVCRIVVLSVMVVRCIGTGCRIVRLSTIVMIQVSQVANLPILVHKS